MRGRREHHVSVNGHRPCRCVPPVDAWGKAMRPAPLAMRTLTEVAAILGVSVEAVRKTELSAFRKLAAHPTMQRLYREISDT